MLRPNATFTQRRCSSRVVRSGSSGATTSTASCAPPDPHPALRRRKRSVTTLATLLLSVPPTAYDSSSDLANLSRELRGGSGRGGRVRTELRGLRRRVLLAMAWSALLARDRASAESTPTAEPWTLAALSQAFEREVRPLIQIPGAVVSGYRERLQRQLLDLGLQLDAPQLLVLVDRNPKVQALLIFWGSATQPWQLIGASPVSTGLPGRYEHFETPLGVFEHSLFNPDFRAEGTKNDLGIRGYGRKGARVFDFGWVPATKGWGNHGLSVMRLQMHATDPDFLERRLGSAQSKGCIRISASLNEFMDRLGVLDQDYEEELRSGRRLWVLRDDRRPSPWSGRYLVVIDSGAAARPARAPAPR